MLILGRTRATIVKFFRKVEEGKCEADPEDKGKEKLAMERNDETISDSNRKRECKADSGESSREIPLALETRENGNGIR